MPDAPQPPLSSSHTGLLLPTLFALLALVALFALGAWQIERKTW